MLELKIHTGLNTAISAAKIGETVWILDPELEKSEFDGSIYHYKGKIKFSGILGTIGILKPGTDGIILELLKNYEIGETYGGGMVKGALNNLFKKGYIGFSGNIFIGVNGMEDFEIRAEKIYNTLLSYRPDWCDIC